MFFFFNDTATTEIYTLSLHDALPIYRERARHRHPCREPARLAGGPARAPRGADGQRGQRSEEHTSELQSQSNLVCRLLLEIKKEKRDILIRQSPCVSVCQSNTPPHRD